jgi:hypothetical protein
MDTVKAYGGGVIAPLIYDIGGEWSALHPSRFGSGKSSRYLQNGLLDTLKRRNNPYSSFNYDLFNDALNISDCMASNSGNCTVFTRPLPETDLSVVF